MADLLYFVRQLGLVDQLGFVGVLAVRSTQSYSNRSERKLQQVAGADPVVKEGIFFLFGEKLAISALIATKSRHS